MPLKKLKFIDGLEEETRKTAISGRTNREPMSAFSITYEMWLPALCPGAQWTCSWAGWWPRLQLTGAGLSGTCRKRSPPVAWPRSDDLVPPPPQCEPPCSEWHSSYLRTGRHIKSYGEPRIRAIIMQLIRLKIFPHNAFGLMGSVNSFSQIIKCHGVTTIPVVILTTGASRYIMFRDSTESG